MKYQTYKPSIDLSGLIRCYWTLEAPKEIEAERQKIIPDGCMEMIFHYGDLFQQYQPDGTSIVQPRCFVFGQITAPLEIAPTGITGIFAVRFFPDGFIPFSTFSLQEMENRAVSLQTLFGKESMQLENDILFAATNEKRIEAIESFLLKRLISTESIDKIVKTSVAFIMGLNGNLSVPVLSDYVKTNRRNLERKFASTIGLSPKQLSKMIRMQATLKLLSNKQFTSLTAIAQEGDYYDQAHFIKDFKEFTGMSPKQFYDKNLKMSALFSQEE